jgi:CRP-like cAMP-binding protein
VYFSLSILRKKTIVEKSGKICKISYGMNFSGELLRALDRIRLFEGLPESEIRDFLRESRSRIQAFEKDELLFRQGEPYTELTIVIEGVCVSEMNDLSGRTVDLGRFRAPFPVAPGFLFSEEAELPVSLRASTPVEAILIPRDRVFDRLMSDGVFLKNFLRLLSSRIGYLTEKVSFHSCRTIREKLLMYLDTLKRNDDDSVTLPMSVEELARYFGVARPSLSQVFIDLQEEGSFIKRGRKLTFPS